jgi:hypothetical protein
MSWKATAFVKELTHEQHPQLTAAHKCLLYTLADYFDEEAAAAWPTINRLAKEALCSSRTAMRLIAQLVKMEILNVVKYREGESTRNRYSFIEYTTRIPRCQSVTVEQKATVTPAASHSDIAVSPKPPSKTTSNNLDDFVEKILDIYPRRIALAAGRTKLRIAIKQYAKKQSLSDREAAAFIYRRTLSFKQKCDAEQTEEKFIPYPATWFHQGRFLEVETEQRSTVAFVNPADAVREQTRRNP